MNNTKMLKENEVVGEVILATAQLQGADLGRAALGGQPPLLASPECPINKNTKIENKDNKTWKVKNC